MLKTNLYTEQIKRLPKIGQHIVAQTYEDLIVVYQAYKPSIAKFSTDRQILGGSEFSYNRMSWIKPNFLWMMYRCGWAEKKDQERVLAIWIKQSDFETILENAVYSSFQKDIYKTHDHWQEKVKSSEIRLQWDPDHDPYGQKIERRAIQLGLRGESLEKFGTQWIQHIEDITEFVKAQKEHVDNKDLEKLLVPEENVFVPSNSEGLEDRRPKPEV